MKILFILKESTMRERLGIMYLSSALKSRGHETRLALAGRAGLKGLLNTFRGYRPHVAGYSAMTGEHLELLKINDFLKERFKFISVFGGPHATFFPDLIHEKNVDAICLGESDVVFAEFCKRLENGENYWETQNFIVKYNGNIFSNPLMPLIENLDSLEFPDRDLMYKADPDLLTESGKVFFSSRGCPYKCSYCFNKRYNEIYLNKGNIVRFRTPENFVEEIYAVKNKYPLTVVYIEDDTFILKPKSWFVRFGKLYKEKIGLPFNCHLRANLVTEENISLLKDTGLDSAWMGVECANETVANDILGRNLTNSQILKAAKILKRYGIKLATQNMVGMPVHNSYKVDLETLDFNININPTFAWSSILYPYPGTQIADYAQKNGFIGKMPLVLETNKRSTVFEYPKDEKRKIENLHKLFGIIVRFPFLRRFCTFLCKLPLGAFYTPLFYLWYGYNMKVKIVPFYSFRSEIGKYLRLWMRVIRKN